MMDINWDLSELEEMWAEREQAVERAKRGIDVHGMTRPAREPDEHRWLEAHGGCGPFRETVSTQGRDGRRRKSRARRAS
jgi:hypothetical protein